jgi:hypothetical protein
VDAGIRAVVLVEGTSDRIAVERLAARRGRDLAGDGVAVVVMGGATNVRGLLERYGPHGRGLVVAGLCDAREAGHVRWALAAAGLGAADDRAAMAALGFHVCVADLEDELIRAVGADRVARIAAAVGEHRALTTFQRQPAHRDEAVAAQLRRFIGTRAGRKDRYARLLSDALDLDHAPAPLDGVLAAV